MSAQIGGKFPGVKETDHQVSMRDNATIACRVYAPEQASGGCPLVVIYHGGGWCIGGLENEELLCRLLTSKLGCVCVNVDYRLAPEHKFPVPVHDSLDATKWVSFPFQPLTKMRLTGCSRQLKMHVRLVLILPRAS